MLFKTLCLVLCAAFLAVVILVDEAVRIVKRTVFALSRTDTMDYKQSIHPCCLLLDQELCAQED
jgi:hypothetical protein